MNQIKFILFVYKVVEKVLLSSTCNNRNIYCRNRDNNSIQKGNFRILHGFFTNVLFFSRSKFLWSSFELILNAVSVVIDIYRVRTLQIDGAQIPVVFIAVVRTAVAAGFLTIIFVEM